MNQTRQEMDADFECSARHIINDDLTSFEESCRFDQNIPQRTRSDGKTLLMLACELNNLAFVEYFSLFGLDTKAVDAKGWNALHHACYREFVDVDLLAILTQMECDKDATDKGGNTPLDLAFWAGNDVATFYLSEDKTEMTASEVLYDTIQAGFPALSLVRALSASKFCLVETVNGETCLHLAVKKQLKEAVKALLESGVDPACQDMSLSTPLHLAIKNNDLEMVELLIEHESVINVANNEGKTAIDLAVETCDDKTVDYMRNKGMEIL